MTFLDSRHVDDVVVIHTYFESDTMLPVHVPMYQANKYVMNRHMHTHFVLFFYGVSNTVPHRFLVHTGE
jgi:hypothetical protein